MMSTFIGSFFRRGNMDSPQVRPFLSSFISRPYKLNVRPPSFTVKEMRQVLLPSSCVQCVNVKSSSLSDFTTRFSVLLIGSAER